MGKMLLHTHLISSTIFLLMWGLQILLFGLWDGLVRGRSRECQLWEDNVWDEGGEGLLIVSLLLLQVMFHTIQFAQIHLGVVLLNWQKKTISVHLRVIVHHRFNRKCVVIGTLDTVTQLPTRCLWASRAYQQRKLLIGAGWLRLLEPSVYAR